MGGKVAPYPLPPSLGVRWPLNKLGINWGRGGRKGGGKVAPKQVGDKLGTSWAQVGHKLGTSWGRS